VKKYSGPFLLKVSDTFSRDGLFLPPTGSMGQAQPPYVENVQAGAPGDDFNVLVKWLPDDDAFVQPAGSPNWASSAGGLATFKWFYGMDMLAYPPVEIYHYRDPLIRAVPLAGYLSPYGGYTELQRAQWIKSYNWTQGLAPFGSFVVNFKNRPLIDEGWTDGGRISRRVTCRGDLAVYNGKSQINRILAVERGVPVEQLPSLPIMPMQFEVELSVMFPPWVSYPPPSYSPVVREDMLVSVYVTMSPAVYPPEWLNGSFAGPRNAVNAVAYSYDPAAEVTAGVSFWIDGTSIHMDHQVPPGGQKVGQVSRKNYSAVVTRAWRAIHPGAPMPDSQVPLGYPFGWAGFGSSVGGASFSVEPIFGLDEVEFGLSYHKFRPSGGMKVGAI
jgi:hypothetical protein